MSKSLQIFISHSSKDNELTRAVEESLKQRGTAQRPLDVLVDTSKLEAADPWPLQLHEMMADCHAAVILMTPNAVESDWVLKEATILTWRGSLEPKFKVFVVETPGLDMGRVASRGFAPLQHRTIQGIVSADPSHIAERVFMRLEADAVAPIDTEFDHLVSALSDVLRLLGDPTLELVADRLGTDRPWWRPGVATRDALIERIATHLLRGQLGTYATLSALMVDLRATSLTRENREMILRLAGPHWVDTECAAQVGGLAEEIGSGYRCRPVGLNGNHARRFTGKMYVERAFPLQFKHRVFGPLPPAAGDDFEHYKAKICAFCRAEDERRPNHQLYEDLSDDALVEKLAREPPWLFVVLPPIVDANVLGALLERFPHVRFVIAIGADGAANLPSGVPLLKPLLDPRFEATQLGDYEDAVRAIT